MITYVTHLIFSNYSEDELSSTSCLQSSWLSNLFNSDSSYFRFWLVLVLLLSEQAVHYECEQVSFKVKCLTEIKLGKKAENLQSENNVY